MKLKILLLLSIVFMSASAQKKRAAAITAPVTVQSKNYYLLTLLQSDAATRKLIEHDPALSQITQSKLAAIREAMTTCKDAACITGSMKFTDAEINTISERLSALYQPDNALGKMVSGKLIPSYAYSLYNYNNLGPQEMLLKAWQQDAQGINNTIAIYAEGKKPNYPAIDSISLKIHDKGYKTQMYNMAATLLTEAADTKQFFMPSMEAALVFLDMNGRRDIANYEPMETTVNKAAVKAISTMNWTKYPYTVILVPGEGPEDADVALDPSGMLRCRLAAAEYFKGIAPFIMVTGGKVHPYKTPYCEAEEMKKYLMDVLKVPESALIMEPHARHTTTNMRNASRLMFQYHFPTNRAGVVLTDKSQSNSITNMDARCMRELHYVPYKLGKRLSDTEQEFFPVKEAFQINATEPLDP